MISSYYCALFFFTLLIAGLCEATNYDILDFELAKTHELWMAKHGRVYKDEVERTKRFKIFKDNLKFIEDFNSARKYNYTLSMNEFSDLTHEEFKSIYSGGYIPRGKDIVESERVFRIPTNFTYPASIDWRDYGAVSAVQSQGQCGGCWAFATAAVVEGLNKIVRGILYTLSTQQMLDCDSSNSACDGGRPDRAYYYIYNNGGLTTADNYPYKGYKDYCDYNKAGQTVAKLSNYYVVPQSEAHLMAAVAQQPVAVAIDSKARNFQFYGGGIYEGPCGNQLDHAVTLIGYGQENGVTYGIVKNSWGSWWGEGGFVRMRLDVGGYGLCGIATDANYPTL